MSLTKNAGGRFAKQFAILRDKLGLSSKEVASALGVSERAVAYWIRGRSIPSNATAVLFMLRSMMPEESLNFHAGEGLWCAEALEESWHAQLIHGDTTSGVMLTRKSLSSATDTTKLLEKVPDMVELLHSIDESYHAKHNLTIEQRDLMESILYVAS